MRARGTRTNASALAGLLGRRLEHDGCENGARLDVAIVFEEEVTLGVIEAIKQEWPALANLTSASLEACEEAEFDPIGAEAPPDDDGHRDTSTILLLVIAVGGAILCCCACGLLLVDGRRRRRCAEDEHYNKTKKRCERNAEETGLMVGELSSFIAQQNRPKEVNLTFRLGKF